MDAHRLPPFAPRLMAVPLPAHFSATLSPAEFPYGTGMQWHYCTAPFPWTPLPCLILKHPQ